MKTNLIAHLACLAAGLLGATAIAHAATPPAEIVIQAQNVFPESLTSAPDGSVIFGSIGNREIYRAKPGSATAETWIRPGSADILSIFGVFADPRSNTLWACSSTPAFGPPPPGAPPAAPATLHAFDLRSGAPKGSYAFPKAGSLCNDIAVDSAGNAYATDSLNMEIVRLKKGAKRLEVWAGNGAFGPKGGILDGISVLDHRVLVNALGTSKLFSVPIGNAGKAGEVAEVSLDRPISRPDGMRSFGNDQLLIIEGGNGGRLAKITMDGNTGRVQTVKEGYPDGPVAVTVVGTTAYVLEGQLSALMRRPGTPAPAPRPFKATAVEVGRP